MTISRYAVHTDHAETTDTPGNDMKELLEELRHRLLEVNDLHMASALLRWDQATYMPSGGAEARGRQLATLSGIAHAKFIDPALGHLLDRLEASGGQLSY